MKIKSIFMLCASALIFMAGCSKGDDAVNAEFNLSTTGGATVKGSTWQFTCERQTITIDVEVGTDDWEAISPTDDVWCSFSKRDKQLVVTVSDNEGNERRKSWIEFRAGDTKQRIFIDQDYLRRLSFQEVSRTIAAASGRYALGFTTNIDPANLKVTAEVATAGNWLTDLAIGVNAETQGNEVTFKVSRNQSSTDTRLATIRLTGEGRETEMAIMQNAATGFPYLIDISGIDHDEALVYEIWDDMHNVQVGEICYEFLYKLDEQTGANIVKDRFTVAYPIDAKSKKLDYANGLVIENGGSVTWNMQAEVPTGLIANYTAGKLEEAPATIYMGEGAASMTTTPLEDMADEDYIRTTLRPVTVVDKRSGAANNHGGTSEENTYRVVKIGSQYWMAENFRATRWTDGSPIPTNIDQATWATDGNPGLTLVGFINASSSRQTDIDANNDTTTAEALRQECGVSYNYYAVTKLTKDNADLSKALTVSLGDYISPEGWQLPSKDEFTLLVNYCSQSTGVGNCPTLVNGAESGFNVRGGAQRSFKTGTKPGYNSTGSDYWMRGEYSYLSSCHVMKTMRIDNSTGKCEIRNTAGNSNAFQCGNYIRLIRK